MTLEDTEIQIMRIVTRKTNNLKTLYGRSMQHKNVNLCPMGRIGFYLRHRFHTLKEKIDFTDNKKWFNIKLLINSVGTHWEEAMDVRKIGPKQSHRMLGILKSLIPDVNEQIESFAALMEKCRSDMRDLRLIPADVQVSYRM